MKLFVNINETLKNLIRIFFDTCSEIICFEKLFRNWCYEIVCYEIDVMKILLWNVCYESNVSKKCYEIDVSKLMFRNMMLWNGRLPEYQDYVKWIANLTKSGFNVIGYFHIKEGSSDINSVKSDIRWSTTYKLTGGIFVDE